MANVNHRLLETVDLHVPGYLTSSDPGSVGAGKYWVDTALGTGQWVLKIRNATNTAWESAALSLVIHNLTGKTTLDDDDVLLIEDSAASYVYKKVTYANLIANLAAYKVKGTEADTPSYLEQYVDGYSLSYGEALLLNPSFEIWDSGWSDDVGIPTPPTSWTLGGVGALISRDETYTHGLGYYSAKFTRAGANCYLLQTITGGTAWQNKTLTFKMWVYAEAGDNTGVYLQAYDGIGVTLSSPHSNDAGWELLSVTHTCSASATQYRVGILNYVRDQSIYIDDAVVINESASNDALTVEPKLQLSNQVLLRLEREYRRTHVKKLFQPGTTLSWGNCMMEDDTVRVWGSTIWNGMGEVDACNCEPTKLCLPASYRTSTHGKIVDVQTSYYNQYVLTENGYVYSAGQSSNYQCGDGSAGRRYVYNFVRDASAQPLVGVVKMVIGDAGDSDAVITCGAITSSGALYIWGYNAQGQHGQGDTSTRGYASLVTPQGGSTGWTDVAISGAGAPHVVALTNNGKVYTWGYNVVNQLGTGDGTNRYTPYNTGLTGITKVWAGGDCSQANSYALKSNGVLYGWGDNRYGALGLGHASQVTTPTASSMAVAGKTVVDLFVSKAYYISVGARYSDGYLYVAGYNGSYQLGTGDATQRNSPYHGGITSFTKMCWMPNGSNGNQMVLRNGILYTCGYSAHGQCGQGVLGNVSTLTPVYGFEPYEIVDMSGYGADSTTSMIALDSNGNAYSCGNNALAQLGHSAYDVSNKSVLTRIRF